MYDSLRELGGPWLRVRALTNLAALLTQTTNAIFEYVAQFSTVLSAFLFYFIFTILRQGLK